MHENAAFTSAGVCFSAINRIKIRQAMRSAVKTCFLYDFCSDNECTIPMNFMQHDQ